MRFHALEDFSVTWVVEESLQEVVQWHPSVKKVIPMALRSRWRKHGGLQHLASILQIQKIIQSQDYDVCIDAQGLLKVLFLSAKSYYFWV